VKPHLCVLLLLGRILCGTALAQAGGVVVLAGQGKEYYQACQEGLKETLEEEATFWVLPQDGDSGESLKIDRELQARNPSVVATLGTQATRWAVERASAGDLLWPVCFAMVPSRASLGLNGVGRDLPARFTGVLLQIPFEKQIDLIRKVLPGARRLGVVFSNVNQEEVARLRDLCEARGLLCESSRVAEPRELAASFESLSKAVDVLFALPDPVVYSGVSARYVLQFSLERRIPLVGFSEAYVKGGALMGLYADPKDVGRQWGAMVNRILAGAAPGSIPLEFPQKVRLGWNRKVAGRLGIPEPDQEGLGPGVVLELF
jgi:putative ABC transport system substrate-binding protein